MAPSCSPEPEDEVEGTLDAKRKRFHDDLQTFREEMEADIESYPRIDGRNIDLFDLGQAVALQNVPPEEVDWIKVAEVLGFDWEKTQKVTSELGRCYEDNLAEFVEGMSRWGDADVPSSPPGPQTHRKRYINDCVPMSMEKASKRRRLDPNAEIPSTPEERLGLPTTDSPSVLRANHARHAQPGSPSGANSPKLPHVIEDEDEDEDHEESDPVVSGPSAKQTPRLERQQSTFDVTPSQQLHSEALDASPIPLNLGKRRLHSEEPHSEEAERADEAGGPKQKRTPPRRTTKRSLPASFEPAPGRVSPQQAAERARRPSVPVRVELGEEGNSQDIRECVEYYESLGYSRPIVIESLWRTTMTPGWPTSPLLEKLRNKEKVPSNWQGIWTDRDDKSLQYADAIEARKSSASARELNKAKKELDRIVHKHTQEAVDLRRRFLQAHGRFRGE
jgi:hypothetical protein